MKTRFLDCLGISLILILISACSSKQSSTYHKKPFITSIATIDAKTLAITIQAGEMIPSEQRQYKELPGDSVYIEYDSHYGFEKSRLLIREGEAIGWLTGENHNWLTVGQRFAGDTLDLLHIDENENYSVISQSDTKFSEGVNPASVFRKSKPNNWLEPSRQFLMEHKIYLQMKEDFSEGHSYTLDLGALNTEEKTLEFTFNSEQLHNEAIHVSAIGYRPNDPGKRAYLSAWLGNGGAVNFGEYEEFSIVDQESGEYVYQGEIKLAVTEDQPEQMKNPKSFGKTNVYHLDFGDLKTPGEYKIVIEGLGSSYPFTLSDEVWTQAMQIAMRGFMHIRANIPLGPPNTTYTRPSGYYPGKHVTVYQSTASLLNTGDGLNALNTDTDNFGNLLAGRTEITDTLGWGGYHDAGDWDRRIQHLHPSRWHLELYELFPEYYDELTWNIPESENALPDIIDEAIFNIDFYRRLQLPEGGIRGGIEAAMHPVEGEVSWMESLDCFVYAPDMWSSFIYAGVAARLAYILQDKFPEKSEVYAMSAQKAMDWGEQDFQQWMKNDTLPKRPPLVFVERSHAALEMYRLTGETKYESLFMEYSYLSNYNKKTAVSLIIRPSLKNKNEWDHVTGAIKEKGLQRDTYFLYTLLPEKLQNKEMLDYAKEIILEDGNKSLAFQKGNAYDLASADAKRPLMVSFFSVPQSKELCRAYHISGTEDYLAGVVRSTQFGLGAGPNNQVYMSGLSDRSPKNLFHIDSRLSGQALPEGLISYAQFDTDGVEDSELFMWPITWYLGRVNEPHISEWPVYEMFHDIYRWVLIDEWTPMESLGPNSYVWGYLAGLEL